MKTTIVFLALSLFSSVNSIAQGRIEDGFLNRHGLQNAEAKSFAYQDVQPIAHRSVLLAVTLSLVVPGTGELYAGNFETGKYVLLAEAVIWVTYAAFYTHGNWVRRDAQLFATQRAGASFNSKTDKFDVDIGNYLSMDEYNQAKLRNRELDLLYTDPSYNWKWGSDADRNAFKNARIRSDQIYQNAKFVVAAAVVNRVFSAFSAGRAASVFNRKALIEGAWNLEAYPTSSKAFADGMNLELSFNF